MKTKIPEVVVTGMGVVSPLGNSIPAFIQSLVNASQGFGKVTRFNAERYPLNRAAEVCDPDPESSTNRSHRYLSHAIQEAVAMSELDSSSVGTNTALVVGTTLGNDELPVLLWQERYGESRQYGSLAASFMQCAASDMVRIYRLTGPCLTVITACAAGTTAIGLGTDLIRTGQCQRVIAGGVDTLTELIYGGFSNLGALASQCWPFAEDRAGIILGEGAGAVILENKEHAQKRRAPMLAKILGYGLANDAYHATAPHPEGVGAVLAMTRCLEDADLLPSQIDYLNAHGTGTRANDAMEIHAIHTVFGAHTNRLPVSSLKSQMGHALSGAGAIEFVATVIAVHRGILPPTAHHQPKMDGARDIDLIQSAGRYRKISYAMSNSFAFGGHTASIAIGGIGDVV